MGYQEIRYDVDDRVATVTLNRPEKLNAWTVLMGQEVRHAVGEASRDPGIRVIVLTGAGRGFCAGADMGLLSGIVSGQVPETRESASAPVEADGSDSDNFHGTYAYFPRVGKPVIGALNGATAGLGLVVALYCDVRFASDAAVFTTAFSRRGLIAEHGISWMLPRLIGLPNALDLLLSGRRVDAAEALRLGLVTRVFPAAEFAAGVRGYARELADMVSPRSMRVMKRQLWDSQFQTLAEATAAANADMIESFGSEDFKEGIAHFVEKRAPRFTGH